MKSFTDKFMSNETLKLFLENLLVKILKLNAMGGPLGWLLGILVKNFSDKIITIINDVGEYKVISERADSTVDMEDRNEATDTLNDIMRN